MIYVLHSLEIESLSTPKVYFHWISPQESSILLDVMDMDYGKKVNDDGKSKM